MYARSWRPETRRFAIERFRRGRLIRRVAIHAITSRNERREFVVRVAGIEVPSVAKFLRDEGDEVTNRLATGLTALHVGRAGHLCSARSTFAGMHSLPPLRLTRCRRGRRNQAAASASL
jgi:hypothetical protein